jgi:N-acetylmuramate 1-kinase
VSERDATIRAFLTSAGWGGAERLPVGADWSHRRYERIRRGRDSVILMDASADAPIGSFVLVGTWLRSIGLHAPEVLARDEFAGLLLLEDLGDSLLARVLEAGGDEPALYRCAVDVLLHCQRAEPPAFLPVMTDQRLIELLDLFLDHCAGELPDDPRQQFREIWTDLLPRGRLGPNVFLYRDYHAENLIWLPGEAGLWRMGLLDFQDAHLGPAAYDLVSLVQDARRDVGRAAAAIAVDRFLDARQDVDRVDLDAALAILGAQRAFRILGVAARLAGQGRIFPPGLIDRVSTHLRTDLRHSALAPLLAWCGQHYPEAALSG